MVEPLRVIDETDQRVLLGDLGEQRQRGQPDQEPVGRGAGAAAEHRREGVALRNGQPAELVQHRRTQLVQAGISQLHLRLDADGPRDMPVGDAVGQVTQQRALAHARLAPQYGDPALAGERIGQEPVERLALAATSEELAGRTGILTRRRPPCTVPRLLAAGISRAYIGDRACGNPAGHGDRPGRACAMDPAWTRRPSLYLRTPRPRGYGLTWPG